MKNILLYFNLIVGCVLISQSVKGQDSLIIKGTINKSLDGKLMTINVLYPYQSSLDLPRLKDTCVITDGKFSFALPSKTFEGYRIELLDKEEEERERKGIIIKRRMNGFYFYPKRTELVFLDTLLKDYKVIGNDIDQQTKQNFPETSGAKYAPHEIIANILNWLKVNKEAAIRPEMIYSLIKRVPDEKIENLFNEMPDSLKRISWSKEIAHYVNSLIIGNQHQILVKVIPVGKLFS